MCKIAAGEIPSQRVYEDEELLAFRDITPQAPTHILVIPKEHLMSGAADITDENAAVIGRIFTAIAKIARKEGLESYRIINNCGADAGQTINHIHFHLLGGRIFGAF
jgi:histidine triad (HIT) family protein